MKPLENRLLKEVGPRVRTRGYFEWEELREVGIWKSPRAVGYLERNSVDDVSDITRVALAAPWRLRHRFLLALRGVQRPMASALLTVWRPDEYTVLDVNAVGALHRLGVLTGSKVAEVNYPAYVQICTQLANDMDVSLRCLDRALWKWWTDEGRGM
jgi:hypothetical protein